MSEPLPVRADLEWLKKLSKERLDTLRVNEPGAKLSEAQLAVAREFGFPSWRKLKAHVERDWTRGGSRGAPERQRSLKPPTKSQAFVEAGRLAPIWT